MVKLPLDFKEFLNLLHIHRVNYLLVGGYAVAAHGYPRFTGDLDLWIQTSAENAENVLRVCREFGFDVPNLRAELFIDPNQMTRMGHPPLRIEILNSVSELRVWTPCLDFRSSMRGRIVFRMFGMESPFP